MADTSVGRWLAPFAFALLVIGLWQLLTVVTDIPESSLPSSGWGHSWPEVLSASRLAARQRPSSTPRRRGASIVPTHRDTCILFGHLATPEVAQREPVARRLRR